MKVKQRDMDLSQIKMKDEMRAVVDKVMNIVCFFLMCTVLLPPGVYPIAVKYIISYND